MFLIFNTYKVTLFKSTDEIQTYAKWLLRGIKDEKCLLNKKRVASQLKAITIVRVRYLKDYKLKWNSK